MEELSSEEYPEIIPFKDFLDKTDLETMREYKVVLDKAIPEREKQDRKESMTEKEKLQVDIKTAEKEGNFLESIRLKDVLFNEYGSGI